MSSHSKRLALITFRILLDVSHDKVNERLQISQHEMEASQQRALSEIQRRLNENKELLSRSNSIADKATERLEWLKRLGIRLQKLIYAVIIVNFRIYKEVIAVQRMLANHINRPLAEDPFILEDAMGRIAPVHLRFITSWDAFEAVLQIRFKDTLGSSKVRRGEYVLQESATGKEFDRKTDWNIAFLPGQKVDMSMVFRNKEGDVQLASCPYCTTLSEKPSNVCVQW
jgi:hypothetical protein